MPGLLDAILAFPNAITDMTKMRNNYGAGAPDPYYKPYEYQQDVGDSFDPQDMEQNYQNLMNFMKDYPDLWKSYTDKLSNPSAGDGGVLPLSGLLAQSTTNYEQPFYQQYNDPGFKNNLPGRTPIDQIIDIGGEVPDLGGMNQGNVNANNSFKWENPTAPFGGENEFKAPEVPYRGPNDDIISDGGPPVVPPPLGPGAIDTGGDTSLIDRTKLAELLMGLVGRVDSLKPMQYTANTTKYNAPDLGMFDFNATKADLMKRYGGV